jgi:hypothetical protein
MDNLHFNNQLIDNIYNDFIQQTNNIFIEALKRHGYIFNNKEELNIFISNNCEAIVNNSIDQFTTYYVKGVPFLLFNKNISSNILIKEKENSFSVKYGQYKFL